MGGPCNNPESDWSLPVIFDPSCTPPTTLNLSNNGGGNVAFSWSSPSSTLYEIEYNLINVSQGLNQVYPISGSSNPINYNVNVQSGMGWTISFKVRFRCPNGTMSNWSLQSAQFSL